MEPDELPWIDSVPVRPARRKKITVGEHEWVSAAPAAGEPARLTARFWINSMELEVILVETTVAYGGSPKGTADTSQPRARIGARSYLLFVKAPAQSSTA